MEEVKLYSGTYCPFCRKVEHFMEDNGLSDSIPIVYIDEDESARDALIEGGGKRQVPCLYAKDQWIYESGDIINFLKENFL